MTTPQCFPELQSEQAITVMTPLTLAEANLIRAIKRLRKTRARRILLEIEDGRLILREVGKAEGLGALE